MGLNAALVDRGRKVESRAAGRRVDGETVYTPVSGEWFKCRIQLGSEGESVNVSTGEREVHRSPSVLVALRDLKGDAVRLNVEDWVEISSRELPDANVVWEVISDPEPLRKKRKVIGWQITLRKIFVHTNPDA